MFSESETHMPEKHLKVSNILAMKETKLKLCRDSVLLMLE